MGMGEPFINFDNVIAAARRLPDLGITPRRTTISTVGWMPGLTRFIDEVDEPIRLALSLHAASPGLRSSLMPVNDRYPLPDVLAECRRYVELRGRKVYIEYVMLEGVNDTPRHAAELAAILDPKMLQGEPDPVQPDRDVRRLVARRDRRVQARARPGADPGHGAPHPRPRHRRSVRAARSDSLRGKASASPAGEAEAVLLLQAVIRPATVYLVTDVLLPGVSPGGIALRAASPRA